MAIIRPLIQFSLFILCNHLAVFAQKKATFHSDIEVGSTFSSSSTAPFWLRTNQFGIVPIQAPAGIVQAAFRKDYNQPDSLRINKFDWRFKFNPVLTVDRTNKAKLLLPEAFVSLKYKSIELYAGRKREVIGYGDTTLSSGFYAVSGNALPIPKIQLGTVGYVPLRFTNNFLAVNAAYAHGWFNVPYIQGSYLHQKYFYLRFGKPNSLIKAHFGINHQVTWAGHAEYLKHRPDASDSSGYLPSSWRDYKYVVFSYTPKDWENLPNYSFFDTYRVGNSVGSIDLGLEFNTQAGHLMTYYQHACEDVSGTLFLNFPDGLWGVSFSPKTVKHTSFHLNRITVEYLATKSQSGSIFDLNSTYQGRDNYFNHSQYNEGWSYFGRTLGTPFIAPRQDFDPSNTLPGAQFFSNNRLTMVYFGAMATYRRAIFTVRSSISRNFGTYNDPYLYTVSQFSALMAAQIPITKQGNTFLVTKLAFDQGGLFSKATGGYVGIRKSW